MTTTTFRPAGMSFVDRMNVPTECGCCGRSGLKTTVKLAGSDGSIVWMGTGCAAKAMSIGIAEFKALARKADAEVETAESAARAAIQAAESTRWCSFLTANAGPGEIGDQIARLGGFAAARALYRAVA